MGIGYDFHILVCIYILFTTRPDKEKELKS
jgi:hypothetical protein